MGLILQSMVLRGKKYMGRITSSQGTLQWSWKLERRRGGGEFGHGGGGRRRKGTGRRRCCGAVGSDSLEERGEREVVELMESSFGHGGHRSCGGRRWLAQLGFVHMNACRGEAQGRKGSL